MHACVCVCVHLCVVACVHSCVVVCVCYLRGEVLHGWVFGRCLSWERRCLMLRVISGARRHTKIQLSPDAEIKYLQSLVNVIPVTISEKKTGISQKDSFEDPFAFYFRITLSILPNQTARSPSLEWTERRVLDILTSSSRLILHSLYCLLLQLDRCVSASCSLTRVPRHGGHTLSRQEVNDADVLVRGTGGHKQTRGIHLHLSIKTTQTTTTA